MRASALFSMGIYYRYYIIALIYLHVRLGNNLFGLDGRIDGIALSLPGPVFLRLPAQIRIPNKSHHVAVQDLIFQRDESKVHQHGRNPQAPVGYQGPRQIFLQFGKCLGVCSALQHHEIHHKGGQEQGSKAQLVDGRPLDDGTDVDTGNEPCQTGIPQMHHRSHKEKSQYSKSTRPIPIGIEIPWFNLDDLGMSLLFGLLIFFFRCSSSCHAVD